MLVITVFRKFHFAFTIILHNSVIVKQKEREVKYMYRCTDCKKKFRKGKVYFEKHGLDSPPYERFIICPDCGGILEPIKYEYCRCCGARLPDGVHNYCDKACKNKGERMWQRQSYRRRKWAQDPLARMVDRVDRYNAEHGTRYSYGQYVAIIYPREVRNGKS